MLLGILTLAMGTLALVYPGITLVALMSLLATFGIVGGIVMLVGAGKMRSFGREMDRELRTPSHA